MLGLRSKIDRPMSESMRFSIGSIDCVKRRMFRSFPTMTRGTLMLVSTFERSLFTSVKATLRVFSSSFSVFSSSLVDCSSSFAVSSSSLLAWASSLADLSSSVDASCSSIIDCRYSLVAASSCFSRAFSRAPRTPVVFPGLATPVFCWPAPSGAGAAADVAPSNKTMK